MTSFVMFEPRLVLSFIMVKAKILYLINCLPSYVDCRAYNRVIRKVLA